MIQTALLHAAVAIAAQLIVFLLTGSVWAGGLAGAMFFLGREHAQRQYKIAAVRGVSVKALDPWEGFDFAYWGRDGRLDLAYPVAGVIVAGALLGLLT